MQSPKPLFTSLGDVLVPWRLAAPHAPALITETTTWTVSELAELAADQQRGLATLSNPGDRIALNAANSADYVAALYAIPGSGRVMVPLNTRLTDAERAAQLSRARVTVLLGDPVDGFDGTTIPFDEVASLGRGQPTSSGPLHTEPDDVAWIIFTSGSTGIPKGVLITHASLAAAVATTAAARPIADDDVYLYPFPLFHVAAYNVIHAHVRRRPVVLPDRFDAPRIIELCHTHQVTAMSVAATMLRLLLDALQSDRSLSAPPTLRTVAYGAAPMPQVILREARDVLGCDFAQGYGSTELSGNAVFLGPDAHRRGLAGETRFLGAAGYAGPGVKLRIVDANGTPCTPGVRGEILIEADQVCAGYLDDPETTAATITGGWLHTGDIGVLDDDGLLSILDRAKDIVVTGGENVASREVEDALRRHPQVADVAVIGLPDARWGEAVTAVVVERVTAQPPEPNGSIVYQVADDTFADELRALVSKHLAGYKKPRNVFVATALPHNANGKVDKPGLRAALGLRTKANWPGAKADP